MWIPRPIDTSAIDLPPALHALVDRLARNVHDIWAAQRIADGWTWGPRRDDAGKRHPDLVAYGDLPEGERTYDVRVATETVKTILALGYQIERLEARES